MGAGARWSWIWTARKLAVSAFLLFHMTATVLWVMPICPIRNRFLHAFDYYMSPLGLWQCWAMFAPNPVQSTLTLEAEVIDCHGIRSTYQFLRLVDYSKWRGVPRFRHAKYTVILLVKEAEFEPYRVFAARHAVRQLGLPAESFPVDVRLIYQVRPAPPLGGPTDDPMTPTHPEALASYHFTGLDEVRP